MSANIFIEVWLIRFGRNKFKINHMNEVQKDPVRSFPLAF